MNKEERSIAVDEAEQVQDGNGVTILDLFNAVRKHVITGKGIGCERYRFQPGRHHAGGYFG